MKNHFIAGVSIFVILAAGGCSTDNPGPELTGPEPTYTVKFLGRDSISTGSYRGISIGSPSDAVFTVLEDYREKKIVTYLGGVNNYFSDVTDLKNRIPHFDWLVLDGKFDSETGVQLQLESGKVKSITLNNRKELTQWPETIDRREAIVIGDQSEVLYDKLLAISKKPEFANKFERMVLTTRLTYALYDPQKASLPWTFTYRPESQDTIDQVGVYFKDKKVDYILVDHFENK
ncbi:hypothetical protein [Dyadobacter sp. CY323]|uniref:hypothetical protein n=1 Tax=Dyadobacter sp. CY323 TaxID=2907302 RepID=UPI001F19D0EB|nr:hypothetical protein [Dyadobacter sp. CY323]MCE6991190.1 hypothetical protein [Dyadobacter sp. CY323]